MNVAALDNSTPTVASPFARQVSRESQRDFDALLQGRANVPSQTNTRTVEARQAQAREAAHDLVSTTFIMPMLAAMREDPFRSELFHGGAAEDMFGSRLDQIIADRITRAANFPLVDSVYRQLSGNGTPEVDTHG